MGNTMKIRWKGIVVAVVLGVLASVGIVLWLAQREYPAACMDPGNYRRILDKPWRETKGSLSKEAIADLRKEARAMISAVLATAIPGGLISPPVVKHPIRAMDGHFDGCVFSDFKWEGQLLSCRPYYWYVKRLSSGQEKYFGQVDSLAAVDFRRSPKAAIYSDRFVEIELYQEWYPYNDFLRIPTPSAEAARRLLDAFEVMGAVAVRRGPWRLGGQAYATSRPRTRRKTVPKYARMALERFYMAVRNGKSLRTLTDTMIVRAESIRLESDYSLVLTSRKSTRGVTVIAYRRVRPGSGGPSGGNSDVRPQTQKRPIVQKAIITAAQLRIRVVGDEVEFHYMDLEMMTVVQGSTVRTAKQAAQTIRIPIPQFAPE